MKIYVFILHVGLLKNEMDYRGLNVVYHELDT